MSFVLTLTPGLANQVVAELRVAFPDCTGLFDAMFISNLHQAMTTFVSRQFVVTNLKLFSDRYYSHKNYGTPAQKAQLELIRLIFATCNILVLSKHDVARNILASLHDVDDAYALLERFDGSLFAPTSTSEKIRFAQFRNMVKVALLVVPTKKNKQLIVNIACRLYNTIPSIHAWGKTMCVELRQFAAIFHVVSGVPMETRAPRPRVARPSTLQPTSKTCSPGKRNTSQVVSDSEDSEEEEEDCNVRKAARADEALSAASLVPADVDRTTAYAITDYHHSYDDIAHDVLLFYTAPGGQDLLDVCFSVQDVDKGHSLSEMYNFHPDYRNGTVE